MGRAKNIIKHFPGFYQSEDYENTFHRFIEVFGQLLDEVEIDLIDVLNSHWVNEADNEDSKGLDALKKGDLDKIFALYLEKLGGTSLIKQGLRREGEQGVEDDALYRKRMLLLIQVLRRGAATRKGIIDVVAANLGIFDDAPGAQKAKELIEIIEYIPEKVSFSFPDTGLFEQIEIDNPNLSANPPDIIIKIKDNFPVPIINPRVRNVTSGESAFIGATVSPGDTIHIFPDGRALWRGVPVNLVGALPVIPPNKSSWRIEGDLGRPEGTFDRTSFDYSLFELSSDVGGSRESFGLFDESVFDSDATFGYENLPIAVTIGYERITPGAFRLKVPWEIPGFSVNFQITETSLQQLYAVGVDASIVKLLAEAMLDEVFDSESEFLQALEAAISAPALKKYRQAIFNYAEYPDRFAELDVNPRTQIGFIVNKLKAAGIYSEVAFEKKFYERHLLKDIFVFQQPLKEVHELREDKFNVDASQNNVEKQTMEDRFIASGVFNFTSFDSMNSFD